MRALMTLALGAAFLLSAPVSGLLSVGTDHAHAGQRGGKHAVNKRASPKVSSTKVSKNNVHVKNKVTRNDVDIDIDRNRNVDIDINNRGYYDHYHPIATTAAVIAIGTVVAALPSNCVTVVVGGLAYRQCGTVWYEPRYYGSTVNYVVVGAPG